MKKKNSLKNIISLNFIAAFSLLLLIFFVAHYIFMRRTLIKAYISQKELEVQLLLPEIADYIYLNDIESINTILKPLKNNPEIIELFITDADGNVIYTLGNYPSVQKHKTPEKFVSYKYELTGHRLKFMRKIYYTSLLPQEIRGKAHKDKYLGCFYAVYDTHNIVSMVNKQYVIFLPFMIFIFFSLYLWIRHTTSSIISAVINIKDAMQEYMRGNRRVRIFLSRTDELEELAESFNTLAEELNRKITELEELNRELDKKVEERTREIERKNELLQRQNEEIMQASKMKSEFLANVSHELRTPLNSILGFSQVLLNKIDGELSEKQLEDVRIIYENGKHLLSLINEILDLSKIEAGRIKLTLEYVKVQEIIDDVIHTLMPLAKQKNLYLVAEYADHIPEIYADYLRIKQILLNLVNNAIKFTEEGGVTVKAYPVKNELCIEVSDTGIGISHEDLTRIFDAFTQIKNPISNQKPSGTGLGLTIAKNYIELMNGRIDVSSEPDIGTTFKIYFPLPPKRTKKRFNIAVVEDDHHAVRLYEKFLKNTNCGVLHFPFSQNLIEELKKQPFSLIVLDILLPDERGWDILKQIKDTPELSKIPVVVISVLDKKQQGFALGADDYLVKPIEEKQFIDAITKFLPLEKYA